MTADMYLCGIKTLTHGTGGWPELKKKK